MIFKLKNIFPLLKIFKPILLSIFISSMLILSACSDDPVTPQEPEFDPPRFNWRSMEVPGDGYAGMWALDTNNIYLVNIHNNLLYHISNGNLNSYNYGNYGINEIEGISENEVYLFGAVPYPDNNLTIIKWNGSGFEYYPTGILVNEGRTIRGCVVSSGEVWIGSEAGLSRFNGITLQNYSYENPDVLLKNMLLSSENKVQYISERLFNETTVQQSLYEFRDSGFVLLYDEITNPFPGYSSLNEINGIKYGLKLNRLDRTVCFENFTGTAFSEMFCLNSKVTVTVSTQSNNPVGISLQEFISFVEVSSIEIFVPGYRSGVIHWNGVRPSAEIGLSNGFISEYERPLVHSIDANTYLVLEPQNPANRVLFIGTRKKQ
jgi:hypothetical protein